MARRSRLARKQYGCHRARAFIGLTTIPNHMRIKSVFIILALTAGFCELQPPAQSVTVLHAFAPVTNGTNTDGTLPYCALAVSGNVLFGTTYNGGAYSNGTVFAMN